MYEYMNSYEDIRFLWNDHVDYPSRQSVNYHKLRKGWEL